MKTIARMTLEPGMVLASDVFSYQNELLLHKNTTLTPMDITKLAMYSIMCVDIMEPSDYATTHYEKVRLSSGFQKFEKAYNTALPQYKKIMFDFVVNHKPVDLDELFTIYMQITSCCKTGEILLDYLYNMLPSEDDMTYAHCLNSALIAGVFGTWLGISEDEMITLICCAYFYDIGKLLLPAKLIWKPDKLTPQEFEMIKTHTLRGFNLIKDLDLDENIMKATLEHHERCDGTGYPSHLRDRQINVFAKYISIIDAYEAMTSARTYRESLTPMIVVENFEKSASYYTPSILLPILQHIANSQLGMKIRLSDDKTGEIIMINSGHLSRPLVKCGEEVIDLSKHNEIKIVATI